MNDVDAAVTGDFWLGVLGPVPTEGEDGGRAGGVATPPLLTVGMSLPPGGRWLVEAMRFQGHGGAPGWRYLVLLCSVDGWWADATVRCRFGFGSDVRQCDWLRENGLRVVETRIDAFVTDDGSTRLLVRDPLAVGTATDRDLSILLQLSGLVFTPDGDGDDQGPVVTLYSQDIAAPDIGASSAEWVVRPTTLALQRRQVLALPDNDAWLRMPLSKRLNLAPLAGASHRFEKIWCGPLVPGQPLLAACSRPGATAAPAPAPAPAREDAPARTGRSARAAQATPPAPPEPAAPHWRVRPALLSSGGFRFEDVELYGFRIDLNRFGRRADMFLEDMIRPLNFHTFATDPATGRPTRVERPSPSFRFRAASRTVVIELLRYGRMLWGARPAPAGTDEPFTSQHELLLRVLVGRVDDDTSQARDPAVFVPAVMVDNPWSKLLGRELQGFKKRLVRFVDSAGEPLSCGGFDAQRRQRPLADIEAVWPVLDTGAEPQPQRPAPLLTLQWPTAAGGDLPGSYRSPWRQRDFGAGSFQSGFAGNVLAPGWNQFQSIQVTPVDERALPSAWITGGFTLERVQASYPSGIVTLTLGDDKDQMPRAWRQLRSLFRGEPIALNGGDWYRVRCALRMRVGDGVL